MKKDSQKTSSQTVKKIIIRRKANLQISGDENVKGKSPKEVQEYLTAQMKEALDYFEPQATKQYNLDCLFADRPRLYYLVISFF